MHDGVYIRVFRRITYIATGILTQVHAAMWVKVSPHDLMNCCMVPFGSYTAESRYTIYDWCSSAKMRSRFLP